MEILIVVLIAIAGVAAVIVPLARGGSAPRRVVPVGPDFADDAVLDAEVERYRAALRAGTLCGHCRYANPGKSNYCADCGRPLGGGDD